MRLEGSTQCVVCLFFFSSRRRHTRFDCDWSSDVCSSDLQLRGGAGLLLTSDGVHKSLTPTTMLEILTQPQSAATALVAEPAPSEIPTISFEIGRASCRERV